MNVCIKNILYLQISSPHCNIHIAFYYSLVNWFLPLLCYKTFLILPLLCFINDRLTESVKFRVTFKLCHYFNTLDCLCQVKKTDKVINDNKLLILGRKSEFSCIFGVFFVSWIVDQARKEYALKASY